MAGREEKDPARMRVSIVAGPAVPNLVEKLAGDGARIGVLANADPGSPRDKPIFFQFSGDNPERISADVRRIAAEGTIDHLIVQCTEDRPPMAYASLFVAGYHAPEPVNDVARLTATWFAIDGGILEKTMLRTPATAPLSPCWIAEQLEFVGDIFLDGDRDLPRAEAIASTLNPRARITTAATDLPRPADSFDFEAALDGAGWRQLLDGHGPAKKNQGIAAFAYQARRPFHPERFSKLLEHDLRGAFRAKGFFWLASRMDQVGGLNLAGSEIHCALAGEWWATRDEHIRETQMPERTRAEWQEPFGDRRQSFAVMMQDLDSDALRSQIDECLLTDEEMAAGPRSWQELPDPFPAWGSHTHAQQHDGHCDHDHDSEDHDCCHH